jgi:hypothetical protein
MGFGYAGTFLIIFLTHPGVVLPTTSSVTRLLPPEAAAAVPKGGFPPVLSGLWQVFWAWVLNLIGAKNNAVAWTMYILYLVFLFGYMYFFIGARIEKGI